MRRSCGSCQKLHRDLVSHAPPQNELASLHHDHNRARGAVVDDLDFNARHEAHVREPLRKSPSRLDGHKRDCCSAWHHAQGEG
jgi:hypothetical protein